MSIERLAEHGMLIDDTQQNREHAILRYCKYEEVLTTADGVMSPEEVKEMREENAALKSERDALAKKCGGTIPVHCANCELWGSNGWSQQGVGYCEGDDKPHEATDFCSYGKKKEELKK